MHFRENFFLKSGVNSINMSSVEDILTPTVFAMPPFGSLGVCTFPKWSPLQVSAKMGTSSR